jgi:hypothetical protein
MSQSVDHAHFYTPALVNIPVEVATSNGVTSKTVKLSKEMKYY